MNTPTKKQLAERHTDAILGKQVMLGLDPYEKKVCVECSSSLPNFMFSVNSKTNKLNEQCSCCQRQKYNKQKDIREKLAKHIKDEELLGIVIDGNKFYQDNNVEGLFESFMRLLKHKMV